jgi:indolepyruvate ferredoxin oxidoreductase alpha subunit
MGERSFAEDVKQLGYGEGEILHGEGILAITKALLSPASASADIRAPVSYLIDVRVVRTTPSSSRSAFTSEQSGSGRPPLRSSAPPSPCAVTWKSVVGTNVASDALARRPPVSSAARSS